MNLCFVLSGKVNCSLHKREFQANKFQYEFISSVIMQGLPIPELITTVMFSNFEWCYIFLNLYYLAVNHNSLLRVSLTLLVQL